MLCTSPENTASDTLIPSRISISGGSAMQVQACASLELSVLAINRFASKATAGKLALVLVVDTISPAYS